ncbi:hypothetical protein HRbin18_01051 [bacterium HR18]|nr:hypothetical protein HRbin18_01051 [bacterium HR18]
MLKLDAFWPILAPEAQRPLLQLGKDAIHGEKPSPFLRRGITYPLATKREKVAMNVMYRMRQYQEQAVLSASPEQLVLKLYDLGIAACKRNDRPKVRAVLVELMSALNFEAGGELAERLHALYEFCLRESAIGDIGVVQRILEGLREAWNEGVVMARAA